jgi:hypothetical protein
MYQGKQVKNYDQILVMAYVCMQGLCPHNRYPDLVRNMYNLYRVKNCPWSWMVGMVFP